MKSIPKPVVTTIAIATLVALVVGGALVAFNISKPETETNPTATSTYTDRFIDEGLVMMEPPDLVTPPSAEAVAEFGEEAARQGTSWAEAFATYTAYVPSLWEHMTDTSKPVEDRKALPIDYQQLATFMTPAGKIKLENIAGTQALIDANKPGALANLPTTEDGIVWDPMPLRPTLGNEMPGSGFNIVATGVGPVSSYNNSPTLKVTFKDYHIYDWKYDGEGRAAQVERELVYYLAQTTDPNHPWLLDNWEVRELSTTPVKSRYDYPADD